MIVEAEVQETRCEHGTVEAECTMAAESIVGPTSQASWYAVRLNRCTPSPHALDLPIAHVVTAGAFPLLCEPPAPGALVADRCHPTVV